MNPTIKKFILFAVGAASLTKEKFDEFVKQLEHEGALNKDEGEQLVKDFLKESEKRTQEFGAAVEKEVRRVLSEMSNKSTTTTSTPVEKHKCAYCGDDCDCEGEENCTCGEDCDCENCSKPAQA